MGDGLQQRLPRIAGLVTVLSPAGAEAEAVARLAWAMFAGALVVWLLVFGAALWAGSRRSQPRSERSGRRIARWLVVGGGMVAPTLLLGALLVYGLLLMPRLREPPPPGADLEVAVTGEQFWWRVRYLRPGQPPIELANELRLPVGERIRLRLDSPDVIHSLWIPALAGKVDMIPGRTTTLVMEPTRTGVFAGACAEFCGTSHAFMRFEAVVTDRADFQSWLEAQAAPAATPSGAAAERGHAAFIGNGCGACHSIRGTTAGGRLGPDLTHVGSRRTLAAGTLANDVDGFRRWITRTHAVKPDALMPEFDMLPAADVEAIAIYLDGLE